MSNDEDTKEQTPCCGCCKYVAKTGHVQHECRYSALSEVGTDWPLVNAGEICGRFEAASAAPWNHVVSNPVFIGSCLRLSHMDVEPCTKDGKDGG